MKRWLCCPQHQRDGEDGGGARGREWHAPRLLAQTYTNAGIQIDVTPQAASVMTAVRQCVHTLTCSLMITNKLHWYCPVRGCALRCSAYWNPGHVPARSWIMRWVERMMRRASNFRILDTGVYGGALRTYCHLPWLPSERLG